MCVSFVQLQAWSPAVMPVFTGTWDMFSRLLYCSLFSHLFLTHTHTYIRVDPSSLPKVAVRGPVMQPGIGSCGTNSVVFVCECICYPGQSLPQIDTFIHHVKCDWLLCVSSHKTECHFPGITVHLEAHMTTHTHTEHLKKSETV